MNIKPFVFSAFALIGASSPIALAAPAEVTDQVVASFDRLLNHTPTGTAVAVPAALTADADPLLNHLSAALWARPSYHLPVKCAHLPAPAQPKN